MSLLSPNRSHSSRPTPRAPKSWLDALMDEWALAWTWAAAPVERLIRAAIRDGIRPPTSIEGLPPGQFPPIDALEDELFGRPARNHRSAAAFEMKAAPGVRISARADDRELP